jgi:hypothetical protein
MSEIEGLPRRLDRGWRWISRRSEDVFVGSLTVAEESDRWFLGALQSLERGAAHAQSGADALAKALAARWAQIRPHWARRRTARERIESLLRTEGKRQGFDVKQQEFHEFSGKLAILLELVYAGALPLDSIAFEPAGDDSGTPEAPAPEAEVTREALSPGPEPEPAPTSE